MPSTTSINSKVLCFAFGLVVEIERNLISMRTREALAVRRADGVVLGRRMGSCVKQKMLLERRNEIVEMLRGGCTLTALCRRFGVSSKTFHRVRRSDPEIDALYQNRGDPLLHSAGKGGPEDSGLPFFGATIRMIDPEQHDNAQ